MRKDDWISALFIKAGTRIADGSTVAQAIVQSDHTVKITWTSGYTAFYGFGYLFKL